MTFSGPRGQRVPVSLYKITANFNVKPFVTSLDESERTGGRSHPAIFLCPAETTERFTALRRMDESEQWIEGMGIATGLAFDRDQNLYVGDRSGTIFKISPSREIFVFATLEPSVAAYHLAFHPSGELYATGPTTSSFDRVYRISQGGDVTTFFRGLGRPQGLAFDRDGNLFVAASLWRTARNCSDHAAGPRGTGAERQRSRGDGAAAIGPRDCCHIRCGFYPGLGRTRFAAVWLSCVRIEVLRSAIWNFRPRSHADACARESPRG